MTRRGEEADAQGEALTSRKGKTDYRHKIRRAFIHCQKAIYVRESSKRIQIFERRGDLKGSAEFLELRDCVYKDSQGPTRHFWSQNK